MTEDAAITELKIERMGQRGEGLAEHEGRRIAVPHTVPGDVVRAEINEDRAAVAEIANPSVQRVDPICPHFGTCGGCIAQNWNSESYTHWKHSLLTDALAHAGLEPEVAALVPAHGMGRRRVTFHGRANTIAGSNANTPPQSKIVSGFMRARSHEIVAIETCPILCPELQKAPSLAAEIVRVLGGLGKPLDVQITNTLSGLDVDIRGAGELPGGQRLALTRLAEQKNLARIANHGDILVERRPPQIAMGRAMVSPSPGAFLQATEAGENTLAQLVEEAVGKSKRVADLFAGVGTFALRLASRARIHAVENDEPALRSLTRAAANCDGLKPVTTERRDLFRRPLLTGELAGYDAILFDPPRAGAQAQVQQIAGLQVPKIIAVSCNIQSFVRDAQILIEGGYTFESITPVDQFIYSPHLELVACFTKPTPKRPRRRLLG